MMLARGATPDMSAVKVVPSVTVIAVPKSTFPAAVLDV
jgi:hypothetical protein